MGPVSLQSLGQVASLIGVRATIGSSWDSTLIPDKQEGIIIGTVVLLTLAIGQLGLAYPRLMSGLEEQTAIAHDNARLYQELQVAYGRFSELDRLKDTFLMAASHELRTPLTIMQGYLELLREMEDVSPDLRRSFLTNVCRACDELVLIQANTIDASRVEVNAATMCCARVVLKEVCIAMAD